MDTLRRSTLPTEQLIKFTCEICCESKAYNNSFSIKGCNHYYCFDCVARYIQSKLEDNIVQIQCPAIQCIGKLDPESCSSIIPHHVYDRWGAALCESSIPQSFKFYCPHKDCSALLLLDDGYDSTITRAECPYCMRYFCGQCKVSWHTGIDCVEFRRLNKDAEEKEDMILHQLAEKNRWQQCPQCKIYIQISYGCYIVHCRCCGCGFCYGCGVAYGDPNGHFPYTKCFRGIIKRLDKC